MIERLKRGDDIILKLPEWTRWIHEKNLNEGWIKNDTEEVMRGIYVSYHVG